MTFVWIFIAAAAGGYVAEFEGVVFGAFFGFLFARIINLQSRVKELERDNLSAESPIDTSQFVTPAAAPPQPEPKAPSEPAPAISSEQSKQPAPAYSIAATLARQAKARGKPAPAHKPRQTFKLPESKFINFVLRGNPIAKVAIVVLFFGVAFLFKYAAERNIIPIEWRLLGIFIAATALLLWGLKLRTKQRLYSLLIQGGALGILYLTVFAAAKFYTVLPLPVALVLMVGLVGLSGYLAIWQDSKSLAIFSTIGGFLAPVLTATNSGNHVQLFSYYAVLNLGILGISWFKAWRMLIWLGFVFTFLIGAAWGLFDYRADLFSTTEPFLVFFFLLYLCIPVLYLRKQDAETRGMLDGSVVFGLPAISFVLQHQMVENQFANGDTWSAVGWGLAYLGAAGLMRWRAMPGSESLRTSYTAIASVFLTVAVFFAFSRDVTSVFWALEGAGLIWLGCRQKQFLPRAVGIALQVVAGVLFLEHYGKIAGSTILLNTQFLVLACISLALLCSAYLLFKNRTHLLLIEAWLSLALVIIGIGAWYLGGLMDLVWYLNGPRIALSILIYIAVSSLLCLAAGRQLTWLQLIKSSQLVLILGSVLVLANYADRSYAQPLRGLGLLAYPLLIVAMGLVLRFQKLKVDKNWSAALHILAVLNLAFLLGWALSTAVGDVAGDRDWHPIIWGLTAIVCLLVLVRCQAMLRWPVRPFERAYLSFLPSMFAIISSLWILASSWQLIRPHDWTYIPVLNPLELVHVAGFAVLCAWSMQQKAMQRLKHIFFQYLFPFLVFIWINSLVAKAVHYWADIRWDGSALLAYPMFQAATSVLWSMLALLFVTLSRKKLSRKLWLIGIILLGAVVLKLMLFDLVDSGTLGRIISFLAVGVLMLIIGYIAPMPPRPESEAA